MKNMFKNLAVWLMIGLVLMTVFDLFNQRRSRNTQAISLGEVAAQLTSNEVREIAVHGDDLAVYYKDPNRPNATTRKEQGIGIFETLRSLGVSANKLDQVTISVSSGVPWSTLSISVPLILMALLLPGSIFFAAWTSRKASQQLNTRIVRKPEKSEVKFDQLGGVANARDALMPVLAWLGDPAHQLGVEVPRGVLITGPSGVGKSLLARALAGESGCALFTYSGAEFVEILVGMGSSRMRAAFADARACAAANKSPVIVFLDHVELIATERTSAPHLMLGAESEEAKTLATLLTELDNLQENGQVYVIAATSRPRMIDPAILAQGRLSLLINLPMPDESARKEILDKLMAKINLDGNRGDLLAEIARGTKTFSCAELVQLVQWAREAADKRGPSSESDPGTAAGEVCLSKVDFVKAKARLLPQPRQELPAAIVEYLDRRITGQDNAKKRLAVAVSNHYLRLREATRFDARSVEIRKANVLMIGPTGTGKTMLVEEIATYLQVPYVIFNATILTETGYGGANVEQILRRLISAANQQVRRAEFGIICIDEFDKLAFDQGQRSRHSGGAVQQELLKLVEGTIVDVPKADSQRSARAECYQFDTSNVLFVCLGAFNGIETAIGRRMQRSLGGGSSGSDSIGDVQPEDVISFGFLPELVGRFPVVTVTRELSFEELVAILQNEHNGLMRGYRQLLEIQGYEPTFCDDAIERIAREASRRHVGARGLHAIMEQVLLEPMYRRPGASASVVASEQGQREPTGPIPAAEQPALLPTTLVIDAGSIERALAFDFQGQPNRVQSVDDLSHQLQPKGHRLAKNILALASWQHYVERGSERSEPPRSDQQQVDRSTDQPPRYGVLLVDPFTGRRGQLVASLARAWRVPLAVVRAGEMDGTRGSQQLFDAVVRSLLGQSNFDLAKAQRGIVFIDEFDLAASRVTVDESRTPLAAQVVELIQGRVYPLNFQDGRSGEFDSRQLFLVLGGKFSLAEERFTPPFSGNLAQPEKYALDRLAVNLQAKFNLAPDLLSHLYLVPLDLAISAEAREEMLEREYELVRGKYAPLLSRFGVPIEAVDEEWQKVNVEAHVDDRPSAEKGILVESALLARLQASMAPRQELPR